LTAILFEQITVSGGMRGMLLLLSADDYLRAVNGTLGAIVQN
jgi:Cys-tRNA(Pro)/Cys-tRNA(Cys) deacylase